MSETMVYPGQSVDFTFDIVAPPKSGIYREYFTPMVEDMVWMKDLGIYWDVTVRNPEKLKENLKVVIDGMPEKYIKVDLSEQKLYAYEDGQLKYEFIASTGRAGLDTPVGTHKIYNKYSVAYSAPYQLFMDNWMAISQDGLFGIHALPYWISKSQGGKRVYEGNQDLGKKVSHGCIRVGADEAKLLYAWTDVGTAVYVEK